jgi:hypothetical protein
MALQLYTQGLAAVVRQALVILYWIPMTPWPQSSFLSFFSYSRFHLKFPNRREAFILLSYYPIILLSYYPIILLSYYLSYYSPSRIFIRQVLTSLYPPALPELTAWPKSNVLVNVHLLWNIGSPWVWTYDFYVIGLMSKLPNHSAIPAEATSLIF